MKLRQGRKVAKTIYEQLGDEPSDDDRLVGYIEDPDIAREICEAVGQPRLRPVDEREDVW